jgi:probable rRNA maturation factor
VGYIFRVPYCQISVVHDSPQRPRLPRRPLQAVLDAATRAAGVGPCALTVLLVDARASAALHLQHFADADATDVMTFPDGSQIPGQARIHLGDLAVCIDVAREQARRRGRAISSELTLYILHGLLHLLGYDDTTPAQGRRMWQAQRDLLAGIGIILETSPC